MTAIILPDTPSKSTYVNDYGEENIRIGIHEPRKRFWRKGIVKDQLERGEMPKFRYTITNACLYHLANGEGETTLTRKRGKRKTTSRPR